MSENKVAISEKEIITFNEYTVVEQIILGHLKQKGAPILNGTFSTGLTPDPDYEFIKYKNELNEIIIEWRLK